MFGLTSADASVATVPLTVSAAVGAFSGVALLSKYKVNSAKALLITSLVNLLALVVGTLSNLLLYCEPETTIVGRVPNRLFEFSSKFRNRLYKENSCSNPCKDVFQPVCER